jgi:hypothetical protein
MILFCFLLLFGDENRWLTAFEFTQERSMMILFFSRLEMILQRGIFRELALRLLPISQGQKRRKDRRAPLRLSIYYHHTYLMSICYSCKDYSIMCKSFTGKLFPGIKSTQHMHMHFYFPNWTWSMHPQEDRAYVSKKKKKEDRAYVRNSLVDE